MKLLSPCLSVLLSAWMMGLGLTGCCTRKPSTEANRFDGTANQPAGFCGIFSGFGTTEEPERWQAVYSPVTKEEYGELLCDRLAPEDYATCVNRLWTAYRQGQQAPDLPGEPTSGPFVILLGQEKLTGTYWSQAFAAGFRVSNPRLSCIGGYDAWQGDTAPIFKVRCDNGQRGRAEIVRDNLGRNGIGGIDMEDGTVGNIVFGQDILGPVQQGLASIGARP